MNPEDRHVDGEGHEKESGRVEAFSDGVFAIAITLLILEVKVPRGFSGKDLVPALLEQWPSYAAFLTSFATIGIMWLNHHRLFTLIRRVDTPPSDAQPAASARGHHRAISDRVRRRVPGSPR